MANIPFLNNAYFAAKVGIGTDNPDYKLEVVDSTNAQLQVSGYSVETTTANAANGTIFIGNNALYRGVIDYNASSTSDLILSNTYNNAAYGIRFKVATSDAGGITAMRIIGNGNVGIGTTSPSYKLQVVSTGWNGIQVKSTTSNGALINLANTQRSFELGSRSDSFQIRDITASDTVRMVISNTGKVGIGTTSPDYQLEVENTSAQATLGITGGNTDARLHLKTNNGDWMLQNDYSNNGALSFYNSGHRLVVTKSGEVGIGTTGPLAKLHIKKGSSGVTSIDTGTSAVIESDTTNYLRFLSIDSAFGGLAWTSPSDNFAAYLRWKFSSRVLEMGTAKTNSSITFSTGNADEKMRITSSGNVGIGTTSPDSVLNVEGTKTVALTSANDFLTLGLSIDDNNTYDTLGAGGGIAFRGVNNSSGTRIVFGAIDVFKESSNSADYKGSLRFFTNQNSTGVPLERMRINSSGNVGIGTNSPSYTLDVAGEIKSDGYRIDLSGGTERAITSTGTDSIQFGDAGVNEFKFKNTAGTSMIIASSGNVGIGTTSPGSKLHVYGGAGATTADKSIVKLYDTGGTSNGVTKKLVDATITRLGWSNSNLYSGYFEAEMTDRIGNSNVYGVSSLVTYDQDYPDSSSENFDGNLFGLYSKVSITQTTGNSFAENAYGLHIDSLNLGTNSKLTSYYGIKVSGITGAGTVTNKYALVTHADAGNVGIGTTSPAEKLHVNGEVRVDGNDGVATKKIRSSYFSSSQNLDLQSGSSADIILTSDKVGIGTTSPGKKLDVVGNANVGVAKFSHTTNGAYGSILLGTLNLFIGDNGNYAWKNGSNTRMELSGAGALKLNTYTAGTLVSDASGNITVSSGGGAGGPYLPLAGGTMTGDLLFGDGVVAKFGTGQDLRIQSVGDQGYIQNYTGDLQIQNRAVDKDILFRADDGSGSVTTYLYLDGGGVLTRAVKNIRTNDGAKFQAGSSGDLEIFHDGSNSYIENYTGDFIFTQALDDGDMIFKSDSGSGGTTPYMYLDGSITETRFPKPTRHDDGVIAKFGNGNDLNIFHDGSNSYINELGTGDLYIQTNGTNMFLRNSANGDTFVAMNTGTRNVQLRHANSTKLETTSTGVSVTGAATATTFLGDLNGTINTATTAVTKANATNDTTVATTAFVQNLIGTIPAGLVFQGTWNAATNTPTLTSGSGTTGNFYIVSTDGSTNLDGITDWKVGDWAVFVEQGASDQWEKVDNSSVLDGSGTGQKVTKWNGSGTSNTLTDGPITFSGNDSTFAGNITIDRGVDGSLIFKSSNATKFFVGYDSSPEGFRVYNQIANEAALFINGADSNATFAGDVSAVGLNVSSATGPIITLTDTDATIGVDSIIGHIAFVGSEIGSETSRIASVSETAGGEAGLRFYTGASVTQALQLDKDQNATFAGKILVGTGATAAASLNAYTQTVSSNLFSALRVIENSTASSYWDIGATGGSSTLLNFYHNGTTSPKISFTHTGGATFTGNVGIGTTSPGTRLHVSGDQYENFIIQSTASGFAPASVILQAGNSNARGSGVYMHNTINDKIWYTGTLYNNNTQAWNICYDGDASAVTDGRTAIAQSTYSLLTVKSDGKVGIGTTSPVHALHINKDNPYIQIQDSSASSRAQMNSGIIMKDSTGAQSFGITHSNTADVNIRANAGDLSLGTFAGTVIKLDGGNVGIGTTTPVYRLDVNGGVQAGGVVTYSKVAETVSTTGYAVAGLTAGFNGASAGFEFKCYGGNSKYQRIVYSCHCSGTTWSPGKVIDEGTNDLDVVASANGATITFTFKARSSTQSFSPRIVVQATGHSINSTYA